MKVQQLLEMPFPETCLFCGDKKVSEDDDKERCYGKFALCRAMGGEGAKVFHCPKTMRALCIDNIMEPGFHKGKEFTSLSRDATIEDLEKLSLL